MEDRIRELLQLNSNESYRLYSSEHPLGIYLGLNALGQKSLITILDAKREKTDSSKIIDVKYLKRDDGKVALMFSLLDDKYLDMFCMFCADIISNTSGAKSNTSFEPVIERWETWREFFKRNKRILSEEEIIGLIGELYFLDRYMIPTYGIDKSLDAYIGPNKSHKDFELGITWHEVKAIHNGSTSVTISSLEQLESSRDGFLEVITLDDGSGNIETDLTLNNLVKDIGAKLSPLQLKRFNDKMMQSGYLYDDKYDDYSYILAHAKKHRVVDGFPRINKESLPNGIMKVKYNINLSAIKDFEVEEWT